MRRTEPPIPAPRRRCSQRPLSPRPIGTNYGQPFPYTFAPLNSSRSHPDGNIDWSTYEPISGIPGYDIRNRMPYTDEWMLSIERQAGPKTVLSASYVGTVEPSPARAGRVEPGQSRALPQPQPAQRGATRHAHLRRGRRGHCLLPDRRRPGERNARAAGTELRQQCAAIDIGHANYNALELSARHTSGRLEFSAAYTYSKSLDQSSNIGEEVNPFNPALSYALSSFDVKHNFVLSYEYQLAVRPLARSARTG